MMKITIIKSLLFITFFSLGTYSYAQVGIGTTTPDDSSMLDVQSNAKGVLIPRMLTIERTAITTPANGLLVFDTDTKSFWFYNVNMWKELVSGSSIVDADEDTKVEVEKTTDVDEINFTTSGTERMKIGSDGEIIMGTDISAPATTTFQIEPDGVIKLGNKGASTLTGGVANGTESDTAGLENYTKITTDGSLSYVGNATRWDDLKVPVNAVKVKGATADDEAQWEDFLGNTGLLFFDDKNDANKEKGVTFTVQMPHAWKEGSTIYPHVHWSPQVAPGAERVYWALEYTWANLAGTFPATTTIKSNSLASPNGATISAYEHVITPLGSIAATGKTLSSMLVCRLYRNSSNNTEDTFDSKKAALLEIDFHYQIDSDGSNQEYSKE